MIGTILSVIGGPIVKWGSAWLESYIHKKESEVRIREAETEAKIQLAEKRAIAEIEWENKAQDNMSTTWKDEYLTIIITLPIIMCFIPGAETYVISGFDALSKYVPDWYIYTFGAVVASGIGLRNVANVIQNVRKN